MLVHCLNGCASLRDLGIWCVRRPPPLCVTYEPPLDSFVVYNVTDATWKVERCGPPPQVCETSSSKSTTSGIVVPPPISPNSPDVVYNITAPASSKSQVCFFPPEIRVQHRYRLVI